MKIDISKSEEGYYAALERAREHNHNMGYGNDSKNWDLIRYENDRRKLKLQKAREAVRKKEIIQVTEEEIEEIITRNRRNSYEA
jgi:hypothetical protein